MSKMTSTVHVLFSFLIRDKTRQSSSVLYPNLTVCPSGSPQIPMYLQPQATSERIQLESSDRSLPFQKSKAISCISYRSLEFLFAPFLKLGMWKGRQVSAACVWKDLQLDTFGITSTDSVHESVFVTRNWWFQSSFQASTEYLACKSIRISIKYSDCTTS